MNQIKAKYASIVIEAIESIQNDNTIKNKHPTHVLKRDLLRLVQSRIDKILNELVKEGKLITGKTINDEYYRTFNK